MMRATIANNVWDWPRASPERKRVAERALPYGFRPDPDANAHEAFVLANFGHSFIFMLSR